ncbi:polyphosphate kinase 1 [Xylophilus sp. GOD-11R]|uniref:polyphosphate kinase 1 n=1 Tax=Xylophilus sp. GOD-11R TaxID=3089814 RepID=UPI00298C64BE|nr:polyphosphate kinase 1 [Xylophilus sp. GOD-11R]WPB58703.1 polyphosphate kinase 1 [Xylophilus sp. GOD-11R]
MTTFSSATPDPAALPAPALVSPAPAIPETTSTLTEPSEASVVNAPPAELAHAPIVPKPLALLDRDRSILAFNERVFHWATREDIPLLERLRYLCIVSSNLDEFFEVRAAPHLAAALADGDKPGEATEVFEALAQAAHELVERQYSLYNHSLVPAFAAGGIHILSHGARNHAQRRWVRDYFHREVAPLLVAIGLDPAHPFPQVANKSLNFIVRLQGSDAFGRENEIAILKVPRVLPRLIKLPADVARGRASFVMLSSVIRAHLGELFPGRQMTEFSQFRVTRHSDLAVDEDEVLNLRTALRRGLTLRHYGQAVRLEVSSGCSQHLLDFLQRQFRLPEAALYRVHGPVNLVRLTQLIDLVNDPALLYPRWTPAQPVGLRTGVSIFSQLRERDVLIHQPFESFDGVVDFLREAVHDPQVLAIKQTIYRTGSESVMIDLLTEAVRQGKEVTAVVELKARFDEEANINWAEALESVGAQVVYGIVGLKTHAKMLLVTRREGKRLRRYGHLSTGNYNARTARLYTDLSHLTADVDMTADMDAVFAHLASQNQLPRLKKLLLAPFHLQDGLVERIECCAAASRAGLDSRIVVKMNALTDERLIRALIDAGQAGVCIDLIVRGACMLPAQQPGVTDNIRVRSVIGRFLEHTRVFYFRCDGREELHLSSADWMSRNMLRRVELAWPVNDPALRTRIVDECLVAYLHDSKDAWTLDADGRYRCAEPVPDGDHAAQAALMDRYRTPANRRERAA